MWYLKKTYIAALEALIIKEKEKERLQLERDYAIQTKAYISNKLPFPYCRFTAIKYIFKVLIISVVFYIRGI